VEAQDKSGVQLTDEQLAEVRRRGAAAEINVSSDVVPMIQPLLRRATPDDAGTLAEFVQFASEGLALYLWTEIAGAGQISAASAYAANRTVYPIKTPS
jgi:hypothetical protein